MSPPWEGGKIWFDEDVMRLNVDARGNFLGEFSGEDKILVITKSGHFRTTNFDLSNHFEDDVLIIEKFREGKIWSAAYYDAEQNYYYLKRFHIEPAAKSIRFIGEHPESRLIRITEVEYPRLELKFGGKNRDRDPEIIEVAEFHWHQKLQSQGKTAFQLRGESGRGAGSPAGRNWRISWSRHHFPCGAREKSPKKEVLKEKTAKTKKAPKERKKICEKRDSEGGCEKRGPGEKSR